MRPVVVLGLVLVALAALLVALFSILAPDGEQRNGPTPVAPSAEPTDARPVDLVRAPEEPGGRVEGEPVEAEPADPRTALATAPGDVITRLIGRVSNRKGEAVPAARVVVFRNRVPMHIAMLQLAIDQRRPKVDALEVKTDANGDYSLHLAEAANDYTVIVEHPAYARHESQNVEVRAGVENRHDVVLAEGITCVGYVTNMSGAAVEGARLVLMSQLEAALPGAEWEHSDRLETVTDHTGLYTFKNVAPGNRSLTCSAPGYGTQTRPNLTYEFTSPPKCPDFRLEQGCQVGGRVFGPDRRGILGATIEAISSATATSSRGTTKSVAEGQFLIENLAPGQYTLIVRAPGYSEHREPRIECGIATLEIELSEQGGISGMVVDGRSGAPLSDFRVSVRTVTPSSTVFGRAFRDQAFRGTNGRFEFKGLEQGTYVVEANGGEFAPSFSAPVTVSQGLITPDVVVSMTGGGRIVGRVVDAVSREPIQGARVVTFDNEFQDNAFTQLLAPVIPRMTAERQATSDENGEFELKGLNSQIYQLQITSQTHAQRTIHDRRIVDGAIDDLGTIVLSPGATLRGTVYDAAGQPLAGAEVSVAPAPTGQGMALGTNYTRRTGSDGRYLLPHVVEGTYSVSATRSAQLTGNPFDKILDMNNSKTTITLVDGTTQVQDLYLGGN